MTKKLTLLSGLFAATVLLGGMATVGTASAQDCTTGRATVQAQQHVKHARSSDACAATGYHASGTMQSTGSLASSETSHSSNNPNNNS